MYKRVALPAMTDSLKRVGSNVVYNKLNTTLKLSKTLFDRSRLKAWFIYHEMAQSINNRL